MIRKILAMTMICCMLLGAACIPGVLAEEAPLTEEAAPAEAGGAPEDAAISPEGAEPSEAVAMSEVSETAEASEAVAQTVETVAPKKVVIDQKSTVVVNIGTPVQLTVHFEPSNGAASLTWSSSSKKKAIVDGNGLVTGVAEGTATITVKTSNGKKATVKVKVVDPYKPTGVSLSQTGTVKVNKGETLQLNATLSPSDARSTLTWSSSSKKKVTVDGNGLVTGVAEGTATITVKTSNKKKATVKVQVVDPYKPTGVSLSQTGTVKVNKGETLQLGATLSPSSARSTLTWSSSSKKKATVDGNGLVTGVAEGTATITVKTSNGKKATVKVQVVDPYKPTGVSLSQSGTIQLNRGDKLSLTAVLSPAGAQSTLTWSSSSKAKVSVSNGGVITGLAEGTATITVKTSNGKKATVKVQVVDPTKPTGISLSQSGTVNVYKGEMVQLNAALAPASAKSELSWTSSNKKTATVNSNGVVTGVKEGTVTITVKTYNGKKATVKVKVTAAPKQEVSEGSASGSQDASTGTDAVQSPDEGSSSDSVVSHSSLADQVFQQVNTYRAQNGMGALKRSSALDKAAAIRAREIAEVFSHTRPDGSVWYSVSDLAYGENIARNYQTASGVMNGWINSAGHRANILDSYNTIGIAAVQVNGVMCWVQLFGY